MDADDSNYGDGWKERLSAWKRFGPVQILVLVTAWGVLVLRQLSYVSVQPGIVSDLPSYLEHPNPASRLFVRSWSCTASLLGTCPTYPMSNG